MSTQARVTSLDALEAFRSNLILYLQKSRRAVDDVGDEVRRTRVWLQTDRRIYWEHEIRRRAKVLDQAQQELMTSRLTGHKEALLVRQSVVHKAERALRESEDKLRCIKHWTREYDSLADPALKRLESLRAFLDLDMPKAVAFLANTQKILEDYSQGMTPASPAPGGAAPAEAAPGDPAASPEAPSA